MRHARVLPPLPDGRREEAVVLDTPTLLTDDYRKTSLARAVPYSLFMGGAWYLPPEPDPESARIALRLFPALALNPDLVARGRLSAVADPRPIDFATAAWGDRPAELDPWRGVNFDGLVPHEFQRIDAQYAIDCLDAGRGAYLGWEVGLGKTLGACMVIDGWSASYNLVVCPNSAKTQWAAMLSRHLPHLRVAVVGNTPATRARALAQAAEWGTAGTPYVLITHYEAVPLIDGKNKNGWKKLGQWDLIVVDEAHRLKGRNAKRTAAIRRLKRAGILLLSGSVMSGPPEELFVPLQILRPKKYTRIWDHWINPYMEVVQTDYGQEVVGPLAHTLPAMQAELGEVLVVRRAADHLDIPEPHVVHHEVELHPEQMRVYRELAEELLAELPSGDVVATTDGAALMTALRRVTAGIPMGDGTALSAKHDKAMELILDAGDTQTLVFTWHKAPGHELVRRCINALVPAWLVNGDVPTAKRGATVDRFKAGGLRVLGATISTLGEAVNLQNAGAVVFIEESYSAVDNEQAVGRVVRQGQAVHASVHYIRAAGTVDGRVLEGATTKAALRRLVLGIG